MNRLVDFFFVIIYKNLADVGGRFGVFANKRLNSHAKSVYHNGGAIIIIAFSAEFRIQFINNIICLIPCLASADFNTTKQSSVEPLRAARGIAFGPTFRASV